MACLIATKWNAEAAVNWIKNVQSIALWARAGFRYVGAFVVLSSTQVLRNVSVALANPTATHAIVAGSRDLQGVHECCKMSARTARKIATLPRELQKFGTPSAGTINHDRLGWNRCILHSHVKVVMPSSWLWGVKRCTRDREGNSTKTYARFPAHVYAVVRVSMGKRWEALQPFLEQLPDGLKVRLCKVGFPSLVELCVAVTCPLHHSIIHALLQRHGDCSG